MLHEIYAYQTRLFFIPGTNITYQQLFAFNGSEVLVDGELVSVSGYCNDRGCIISWLGDGECDLMCNEPGLCENDRGDCIGAGGLCAPNCTDAMRGDGLCHNLACNVEACGWDGGDCVNSNDGGGSGFRRRRLETLGGAPAIPPHKGAVPTTRRFTLDLSAALQLTGGANLAYTLRYNPETLVGATAAAAMGEETVRRLAHAITHVTHATHAVAQMAGGTGGLLALF